MVSTDISPQLSGRSIPAKLYDCEHPFFFSNFLALQLAANELTSESLDALGGTQIDNAVSYGPFPAAKDQIEQYLSELSRGNVTLGYDRVLHYYFAGFNVSPDNSQRVLALTGSPAANVRDFL